MEYADVVSILQSPTYRLVSTLLSDISIGLVIEDHKAIFKTSKSGIATVKIDYTGVCPVIWVEGEGHWSTGSFTPFDDIDTFNAQFPSAPHKLALGKPGRERLAELWKLLSMLSER